MLLAIGHIFVGFVARCMYTESKHEKYEKKKMKKSVVGENVARPR